LSELVPTMLMYHSPRKIVLGGGLDIASVFSFRLYFQLHVP